MLDEHDARPRWARGRRGRVVWWAGRVAADLAIFTALCALIIWGVW
ncbi:hypothetical protein [Gordonia sp. (in: high G+C Gram-positive bacteria)]